MNEAKNLKNIINIHHVEFEDWALGDHYAGKTAELAREIGTKKLGFHLEILSPKKFSCPYHFHHGEEEFFLVLEGKAILRQNGQYREISSGDLIHFGTGPEFVHQFYNHTDQDFKFLALSNREEGDIVEYPDSQKIYIRKQKKMFRFEDEVPYITGEEDPAQYWDEKYLEDKTE